MILEDKWYFAKDSKKLLNEKIKINIPTTIAIVGKELSLDLSNYSENNYHFLNIFQGQGKYLLKIDGLASFVDVYFNHKLLFTSTSMFLSYEVEIDLLDNKENEIHLHFRPVNQSILDKIPRARWRQKLTNDHTLRQIRSTMLGHMPGWCPAIGVVGPYKPITLVPLQTSQQVFNIRKKIVNAESYFNKLQINLEISSPKYKNSKYHVYLGDYENPLDEYVVEDGIVEHTKDRMFEGEIKFTTLLDRDLWWPHTHGKSKLNNICLKNANHEDDDIDLGNIGIRKISIDQKNNDFKIYINDKWIFCRGAIWSTLNLESLISSKEDYRKRLLQIKAAGMNMIRIGGTMFYENQDFYDLCDELGILVWQDFMFSNFDYPTTEKFIEEVSIEISQFLIRTSHNVCLTILCGGNEVYQQAAMMGLKKPQQEHKLFSSIIKDLCKKYRSDVPYIENSPFGGEHPFQTNKGVSHYYGVSAYLRDLTDIRRADVKFAAECLALSNIPAKNSIKKLNLPAVHHPAWKQGVPRDNDVSWDFEDVRDYYLSLFYKVDANLLRRENNDRYLILSRAVSYHLVKAVFNEWQSKHSNSGGGLIWQLNDIQPGAGWGIIDNDGYPKSSYFALAQCSNDIRVLATNEGLNGLDLVMVNETNEEYLLNLVVSCYDNDKKILREELIVTVLPKQNTYMNSSEILGYFFDISKSYKFGPISHNVTVIQLFDGSNLISQTCDYPDGYIFPLEEFVIQARARKVKNTWILSVQSNKFIHLAHLDISGFYAMNEWNDILPNIETNFILINHDSMYLEPNGSVLALNNKHETVVEIIK